MSRFKKGDMIRILDSASPSFDDLKGDIFKIKEYYKELPYPILICDDNREYYRLLDSEVRLAETLKNRNRANE